MSLTTRNGYTAPTDSNLSAPFRLRKLSLVPAFLHVQIARIQSVIKANVSIGVGTRRFHSKPGHRVMSVMTIFRQWSTPDTLPRAPDRAQNHITTSGYLQLTEIILPSRVLGGLVVPRPED